MARKSGYKSSLFEKRLVISVCNFVYIRLQLCLHPWNVILAGELFTIYYLLYNMVAAGG